MTDAHSSQPETADAFRRFEEAFKVTAARHKDDETAAAAQSRRSMVETLINSKMDDAEWEGLLVGAREAAKGGNKQYLLLRFPSDLCTDDARAINNPPNDTWPTTLRGKASDIYQRWRETLHPQGFGLSASVLDFPGGLPGDVGLFLQWGEAA